VRREMVSVWEGDGRDGDLEVHGGGVGSWGAMEWGRVDMSGPNCIRGDGVGDSGDVIRVPRNATPGVQSRIASRCVGIVAQGPTESMSR